MIQALFISIGLLSLLLFYYGTELEKKLLLLFVSWQMIVGTLALLKVFEKNPNLFPLLLLGTIALTFVLYKGINKQNLNPKLLLAIHVLRIPVELGLFQLFLQGKIPNLMTFNGWNFDIFVGVSALAISVYHLIYKREINRQFFAIWNIIGIVFLFIIVSFAILSSPLPIQQFAFDQPNIAVLEFPYIFLPTCIVPIVLLSHLLLIKKSVSTSTVNKQ